MLRSSPVLSASTAGWNRFTEWSSDASRTLGKPSTEQVSVTPFTNGSGSRASTSLGMLRTVLPSGSTAGPNTPPSRLSVAVQVRAGVSPELLLDRVTT